MSDEEQYEPLEHVAHILEKVAADYRALRAEVEKLRAALNCFMAMETPTQYRYSRERAEMLANDILRAAAAALKETDKENGDLT